MQYCAKIFNESAKNYKPDLVKCNPSLISSLEWLDPQSELFKTNVQHNLLPTDIVDYLKTLSSEEIFQFLFGLHAINFQFWEPKEDSGFTPYIHGNNSGFLAAVYAFKDFYDFIKTEGRLDEFTQADLFQFFQEIPHLSKRCDILKFVWQPFILEQAYQAVQHACEEKFFSSKTIQSIRNIVETEHDDIFFRKEILFLWDVQEIFSVHDNLSFNVQLPMACDHQVARVFHMFDLLTYSDSLKEKINKGLFLESGGEEEMAIRSACILLSNQICQRQKMSTLDLYKTVWAMRKSKKHPFHLTQTIFY